jgi:hypothetical protein
MNSRRLLRIVFAVAGAVFGSVVVGCPAAPPATSPPASAPSSSSTPSSASPSSPTPSASTTAAAPVGSSSPVTVTPELVAVAARGEFPPGDAVPVLQGKCAICHTTQYLTSQRLTPAQWEKTLKKMRGWGAPIDDGEQAKLQAYLAAFFTPTLPAAPVRLVAPPTANLVPPPRP